MEKYDDITMISKHHKVCTTCIKNALVLNVENDPVAAHDPECESRLFGDDRGSEDEYPDAHPMGHAFDDACLEREEEIEELERRKDDLVSELYDLMEELLERWGYDRSAELYGPVEKLKDIEVELEELKTKPIDWMPKFLEELAEEDRLFAEKNGTAP